jgi:hypothetical protein
MVVHFLKTQGAVALQELLVIPRLQVPQEHFNRVAAVVVVIIQPPVL